MRKTKFVYIGDKSRISPCEYLSCSKSDVFFSCHNGECPGYIDGNCPFNNNCLIDEYRNLFTECRPTNTPDFTEIICPICNGRGFKSRVKETGNTEELCIFCQGMGRVTLDRLEHLPEFFYPILQKKSVLVETKNNSYWVLPYYDDDTNTEYDDENNTTTDYSGLDQQNFDRILSNIMNNENTPAHFLSIPGIYEIMAEHFNNDVLDLWEIEQTEANITYTLTKHRLQITLDEISTQHFLKALSNILSLHPYIPDKPKFTAQILSNKEFTTISISINHKHETRLRFDNTGDWLLKSSFNDISKTMLTIDERRYKYHINRFMRTDPDRWSMM